MPRLSLLFLLPLLLLSSCDQRYRAADMQRIAKQAATNRAASSASVVAWVNADKATWSEFLELARTRMDEAVAASAVNAAGGGTTPAATNAALIDASLFAAAVLDAGKILEQQPDGDKRLGGTNAEQEIAWWSVGRLAMDAAANLHDAGKIKDALNTVTTGPKRWQNEGYWQRFPDHDALVAILMAKDGDTPGAIKRLKSRVILEPPADEVLRTLEGK